MLTYSNKAKTYFLAMYLSMFVHVNPSLCKYLGLFHFLFVFADTTLRAFELERDEDGRRTNHGSKFIRHLQC